MKTLIRILLVWFIVVNLPFFKNRKACFRIGTHVFDVCFAGYLPSRLPTSCLTMAPRFDTLARSESLCRKPLLEINGTGM